jgi:hypothetical protein
MTRKQIFGWAGLSVLFLLMLLAAVALLLASSRPDAWQPYQLKHEQQKEVAERFATRSINELVNGMRGFEPFTFTLTEEEMNAYLASLDELAMLAYSGEEMSRRPSELVAAMDRVGIADPVVDMQEDRLRLLVRSKKGNKIISLDVAFTFTDDEKMYITLEGVRVGLLPIPRSLVSGSLEQLQKSVSHKDAQSVETSLRNTDLILGSVIRSIGGEPVPTRLPFSDSRPKRIHDIEIDEQSLTIHFVPISESEEQE